MFTPDDIDYTRLDVRAMLEMRGIATVDALRAAACQRWLAERGYDLTPVDFGRSFQEVLAELGSIFDWESQFGYSLGDGDGNLNALADGFSFGVSQERGRVLVVNDPDTMASQEPSWFNGFLEIASAHSLFHLACGSRFFVLLVLSPFSSLPGRSYGECKIPGAFWNSHARKHGFLE